MDRPVVRRVSGGAPVDAAFDDWVRPHLTVMRRLAIVTAIGHDPDDIVQDALMRAWQRRNTFDPQRGSSRTWLLAITADRARRTRMRAPDVRLVELDPRMPWPTGDTTSDLDLRTAVRRLPRRQQQAVVLHYFVGLTVAETATLMRCAAGTVKSALSDARAALATALGDDDA